MPEELLNEAVSVAIDAWAAVLIDIYEKRTAKQQHKVKCNDERVADEKGNLQA